MAVNVDTVYKTVLYILNKEQRGFMSPAEFNSIATQVQLEIFEAYFEELNQQLRIPENDSEYANRVKNLEDKIEIFQRIGISPGYTAGPPAYFDLPGLVHRIGTVVYQDATEVQRVERNEYYLIKKAPLTAPTTSYPIYMYENSRIYLHPSTIQTPADIEVSYVVKPTDPIWAYSVGAQGQYVYEDTATGAGITATTGTVQFQLHESEQVNLILNILMYAGVIIRDPSIIQTAAQMVQQDEALEKS